MAIINRLEKELTFSASRSGGPGGQNVNKVNSKVTLKFDVLNSQVLTAEEKEMILRKLASIFTTEGMLVLSSQETRSQIKNRELVISKFENLLKKAFEKRKVRKATKPSKSAVQKRISKKKQHSEKKKWRQKL